MDKSYEINKYTIALIPISTNETKVIEEDNVYIISKSTTEIVKDSCEYFGSSFEGRKEGTKNLVGITYKAPIIIEESRNIIFFPTSSPRFENCTWISLNHVNDYINNQGNGLIKFKNGISIELTTSFGSLENQVLRATRLESVLRRRKI